MVDKSMWSIMAKVKLTVTVTTEIFKWINEEVEKGHFADRSHAVQYSLQKVQEFMKKGEIKF
jgi:Arc/MetJ-type ribon-helix-helix transcriptional regulator